MARGPDARRALAAAFSGLSPGGKKLVGEIIGSLCRDDVALGSEGRRGARQRVQGRVGTIPEPVQLGEVHEAVALPVKPVRGADHLVRLADQRFGRLVLALSGKQLRPYAAPQELRCDVVVSGKVLAYRRELGRLVIAAL